MRTASVERQLGHGRASVIVVMPASCEIGATARLSSANRDTRSVANWTHGVLVIDTKWTLFDCRAGEDRAQVWLEQADRSARQVERSVLILTQIA